MMKRKMSPNTSIHQNAMRKYERDLHETNQFLQKKLKSMEQCHCQQLLEMKRKQNTLESKAMKLGSNLKKLSLSTLTPSHSFDSSTLLPFQRHKDWAKCTKHCRTSTADYRNNTMFCCSPNSVETSATKPESPSIPFLIYCILCR